jgi:hypothetical protein
MCGYSTEAPLSCTYADFGHDPPAQVAQGALAWEVKAGGHISGMSKEERASQAVLPGP